MRVITQEGGQIEVTVGDTRYRGHPLSATERNKLYRKIDPNPDPRKARNPERGAELTSLFNRKLFAATVSGWFPALDDEGHEVADGGIRDEAGELLPCTPETREKVAEFNPALADDVMGAFSKLAADNTEFLRGNSSPSQEHGTSEAS